MLLHLPVVAAHRHARLEPLGPRLVSGGIARLTRQLLMSNAEREVTRNAARQRQILGTERVWLLRPERDGEDLTVCPRRHADHRSVTARDQPLGQPHAGRPRQRLAGEIPDDEVVNRRQLQALRCHGKEVAGRGLDDGWPRSSRNTTATASCGSIGLTMSDSRGRTVRISCTSAMARSKLERDVEVRVSRFAPEVTSV